MNSQDIDARIGEAWQLHYDGNDAAAIEKFLALVDEVPDNVDAYWGLGLSYRDSGNKAGAKATFEKVKQILTTIIKEEDREQGRYLMLARMVDQQIGQMDDFLDTNG